MATTKTRLDTKREEIRAENEQEVQATVALAKTPEEKDADTRQRVAMWCVIGYFAGLILILLGVPIYNYLAYARAQGLALDLKDTLLTYQAVVGTLVGAVVAYYFKTQIDKSER